MVKHDFKVQTKWCGGREEVGTVSGDVITEQISILAPKLLEVADHNCMISNAIRNNVEIEIQATIQ